MSNKCNSPHQIALDWPPAYFDYNEQNIISCNKFRNDVKYLLPTFDIIHKHSLLQDIQLQLTLTTVRINIIKSL